MCRLPPCNQKSVWLMSLSSLASTSVTRSAPRDFAVAPCCKVIKPTIEAGFDYRRLHRASDAPQHRPLNPSPATG